MFQGAWAIKAPGAFRRIPTKYAAFAAHKKREAYGIGVAALIFGTLGACVIAMLRAISLADALAACLRWQGVSSSLALGALFFLT